MSTVIRPEISKKNQYYLSKHRYYELKHFCLQYGEWVETYKNTECKLERQKIHLDGRNAREWQDPTGEVAALRAECKRKMDMVESTANETDPDLSEYIFKAATDGVSYVYLRNRIEMPCSKDMFYDRYRRFFWLLSKKH